MTLLVSELNEASPCDSCADGREPGVSGTCPRRRVEDNKCYLGGLNESPLLTYISFSLLPADII